MAVTPAVRASKRRYMANRWRRFRAAGACGWCGLPITKYTRCNECRSRAAKYDLERYYRRRAAA